jgi:hypothetical protein
MESLRFGGRLKMEQTIDPGLLEVLMPPFSFQPLLENTGSTPRQGPDGSTSSKRSRLREAMYPISKDILPSNVQKYPFAVESKGLHSTTWRVGQAGDAF